MGLQITTKQAMMAVKLYCKGNNFNTIKKELGKFSAQRLVRGGLWFLYKKHELNLTRDVESSIGFTLTQTEMNQIYLLAVEELKINPDEKLTEFSLGEKNEFYLLIEEIKKDRININKLFDSMMDKIKKLENKIKNK